MPRSLFALLGFPLAGAAVAVGALTLRVALGPPDTHWSMDTGGRALVVEHLAEDPLATRLAYPGRDLDPKLAAFPVPLGGNQAYGVVVDGEVVSAYLGPFAWLVLPFALAAGFAGQGVLPAIAGGVAVAVAAGLAARRAGTPTAGWIAAGLLVGASPLLFYSSVLWEHTATMALAIVAVASLRGPGEASPRAEVASGLALAAAVFLREEMAILLAAVALAVWREKRSFGPAARIAAAGSLGVGAHLLFQRLVVGSWLGGRLAVNRPALFEHTAGAVRDLILSPGPSGLPMFAVPGALVLLAGGAILAHRSGRRRLARGAFALGAFALGAVSVLAWARFPGEPDRVLALLGSNSAALILPWALAAAFPVPGRLDPPARDALATSTLLFLLLFLAFASSSAATGVHPGPRLLLPILPAVAVLAAERIVRHRGVFAVAVVGLAIPALLWNVRSLELLRDKRAASGRLLEAISARSPAVVATDLFWLPSDLSTLWRETRFQLFADEDDLNRIARRAGRAGHRELLVVVGRDRLASPPDETVDSPGLPAFSADLHVLRLDEPGGRP